MFVCFCRPGSCNQALSLTARFYPLPLDLTHFSKPPEPTHPNFSPSQNIFVPPSSYYQCLMSVFTFDIEMAKLYVQMFRPLVSIHMRKTERSLSGRLRELKNKRKVQLGNPKSGCVRLRELFITKFKSQFKRGFTKVVVTRAGRLREWSPEELRPYNCTRKRHHISLVQRCPNIRSHSVLLDIF